MKEKKTLISILRMLCITALMCLYSVNTYSYTVWEENPLNIENYDINDNILVIDKDANVEDLMCKGVKAIIILPNVTVTVIDEFFNDGSIYVFGTLNSSVVLKGMGTIHVMKGGSLNYPSKDNSLTIYTDVELSKVSQITHVSGQKPTEYRKDEWIDGWKEYWERRIVCGDDSYPMCYEDEACTRWINDLEVWREGDGKITFGDYQESALAAIETAMQGEKSDNLTGLVKEYINTINSAENTDTIDKAQTAAVAILKTAMPYYKVGKSDGKTEGKAEGIAEGEAKGKAEAFGTLGEKQNGPAVKVTDKDGNEIILYNPKSVEYFKVK